MARRTDHGRGYLRKGKKTYSIIVDGQTEVWYLQMLKKHENLPRIDIKPELPKKKKLSDQFHSVIENSGIYDEVFWLIDFDTVLKENKENRKGSESTLEEFKRYTGIIKRGYPNVSLFVNNPCFELWILLHFEARGRFFPYCGDVEDRIKRLYLRDYEKSQRFYKKRDNNIYLLLAEGKELAAKNAKKLGDFDVDNVHSSVAEIYKILERFKSG